MDILKESGQYVMHTSSAPPWCAASFFSYFFWISETFWLLSSVLPISSISLPISLLVLPPPNFSASSSSNSRVRCSAYRSTQSRKDYIFVYIGNRDFIICKAEKITLERQFSFSYEYDHLLYTAIIITWAKSCWDAKYRKINFF